MSRPRYEIEVVPAVEIHSGDKILRTHGLNTWTLEVLTDPKPLGAYGYSVEVRWPDIDELQPYSLGGPETAHLRLVAQA